MCNVCETKHGAVEFELTERAYSHPVYKATDNPRNDRYNYNSQKRDFYKTTRIYVSIASETILDNLENRRRRPVALLKQILFTARPDLKGRVRWSQTAGCGCGCSPGFIVDTTLRNADGKKLDMWLTLGRKPKPAKTENEIYVENLLHM